MSITLRPYQVTGKNAIYNEWYNNRKCNVMYVSPTGSGKTVLFSDILRDHQGAACAIAHRQELVGQISMALARDEVRHKIIGPDSVVKFIITEHQRELGRSFFDPTAQVAVAGVDTLLRRHDQLKHWLTQVTKWVMDEAHHVLRHNKWGKAIQLMPNAIGLGVTATPCRADGRGLSRDTDGFMDTMVVGPSMRELINQGYLTEYRIFAPPSDLDLSKVDISQATGDYNPHKLKLAVEDSHLVGDVVEHYKRIAPGKLGITFATDVETGTHIANQFRAHGIPAEILSAKSHDSVRAEVLRRFKRREILQLVNVDLFGEGFDLPAVEVVSMARPTRSYSLFVQQFGRGLRVMQGKSHAIIIDHASNVMFHGLPDTPREWSLASREKRPRAKKPDDDIPVRYCTACTQPYQVILKICPYCGARHQPVSRSSIEHVDGDLFELSPEILAQLRGEVDKINMPAAQIKDMLKRAGHEAVVYNSAAKQHQLRQDTQAALRESIAWWAAYQKQQGCTDDVIYRKFYHLFGTDVLSAQALSRPDALQLADKVNKYLGEQT